MPWFFDQYEIRARIAPTIVVLSPLILAFLLIVLSVSDSWIISLSSLAVVALITTYALSFLVGYLGRRIQPALWDKWGGAPTTSMLRWRDETFSDGAKRRMRERAARVSSTTLPSREEEEQNPGKADQQLLQAFTTVKAVVRQEDPEGVWSKHNSEYGFNRNLLGSREVWLISSVLGTLACAIVWYFYPAQTLLPIGTVLACVLSTEGFAMGFMSIAKPSVSSSSWAQALFLMAG